MIELNNYLSSTGWLSVWPSAFVATQTYNPLSSAKQYPISRTIKPLSRTALKRLPVPTGCPFFIQSTCSVESLVVFKYASILTGSPSRTSLLLITGC
ncbi:unnamed protein product [Schistosoma curassoni]|uniref:Ovule protein n=1 Tax=Schistosoma curassoni TaxID=6186 RepID=A0A183L7H4_9TREM|nr:unnamed protein product [Schistosoma curassoni]